MKRSPWSEKTFVAAIFTTKEGEPDQIKLNVVLGFRKQCIRKWVKDHLSPRSLVVSNGLPCFKAVDDVGCYHDRVVVGSQTKKCRLSLP